MTKPEQSVNYWGSFTPPPGWDRAVPYDIRERTFQFAVRVLKTTGTFPRSVPAEVIQRQLVRAATSIGANVEEADGAESKADFIHKVSIAAKEARESRYWIRIVRATLNQDPVWQQLQTEAEEITRILSTIIRNAKRK